MKELIAVVGPTAGGKTRRAVALAEAFNGEIISGDSRQVYVGMDIGTGKDLAEYGNVRHHLIDVRPAGYKYNLHEFLSDFAAAMREIQSAGHLPILCGGSGMYVESALAGVRTPQVPPNAELRERLSSLTLPELAAILSQYKTLHNTTDIDTHARAVRAIEIAEYYAEHPEECAAADRAKTQKLDALVIGIDMPRDVRRERITARLDLRLQQGMIEEVRELLASGIAPEDLEYYGLEYMYITRYVKGEWSLEEMRRRLEIAIHQFAKRQMTWFRGMERRGIPIHWLPYDMPDAEFLDAVRQLFFSQESDQ